MHRVSFLLLANAFLIVFSSGMSSLTIAIHSVVIIIGDKVEMKCNVSGSNLTTLWNYTSWSTSTERVIYRGGDIVDSLRSRYKIDKNISGQHNLIIDSVDLAHAGDYVCISGMGLHVHARRTYIELIVLGSQPICAANISATQNYGREQNHLSIWCSISYAGYWWMPGFSWTKGSEENIAANTTSDRSRGLRTTTSLIIQQLHAIDRGVEFQCQITFDFERVYYTWNYTLPNGPLNLRIVEYGGGLECSADGDPAPTYRWTRFDTKSSIEGPMILLDGYGQTFQCTATNVFGSERKNFTITKCSRSVGGVNSDNEVYSEVCDPRGSDSIYDSEVYTDVYEPKGPQNASKGSSIGDNSRFPQIPTRERKDLIRADGTEHVELREVKPPDRKGRRYMKSVMR